jgi:hypothetical protein
MAVYSNLTLALAFPHGFFIMAKKDRYMHPSDWDTRIRERLMQEFLSRASAYEEFRDIGGLLSSILTEAIESIRPTEDETRLSQVLQSYRTLSSKNQDSLYVDPKILNLGLRVAPVLPGERFWFVAPTSDHGLRFESSVANIDISLRSDVSPSSVREDDIEDEPF